MGGRTRSRKLLEHRADGVGRVRVESLEGVCVCVCVCRVCVCVCVEGVCVCVCVCVEGVCVCVRVEWAESLREGLGFGVYLGVRVSGQGLGFRVWGLGCI